MQINARAVLIGFVMTMVSSVSAFAQWQPNDPVQTGTIHYDGGNVGIGIASPTAAFHIFQSNTYNTALRIDNPNSTGSEGLVFAENGTVRGQIQANNSACSPCTGLPGDLNIWSSGGNNIVLAAGGSERMRLTSGGFFGIGATSPQQKLQVAGNMMLNNDTSHTALNNAYFLYSSTSGGYGPTSYGVTLGYANTRFRNVMFAANSGDIAFSTLVDGTTPTGQSDFTERMTIQGTSGNVGIGVSTPAYRLDVNGAGNFSGNLTATGNIHANGNIDATGVINAKYQDVAEWVPASSDMASGTVVTLDPAHDNQVMPSQRSYDTAVAGVVSAQPGIMMGEAGDSKAKIATTGRVRVKADATNGPIVIGDLLVTSDKAGLAMKSVPVSIGGFAIHRPGTVIGKALQPLASGEGEILVLLGLQ